MDKLEDLTFVRTYLFGLFFVSPLNARLQVWQTDLLSLFMLVSCVYLVMIINLVVILGKQALIGQITGITINCPML